MAIRMEVKVAIFARMLQKYWIEEMGDDPLSDERAEKFVAGIIKSFKTQLKQLEGSGVKLKDVFDIHREILPISSRPAFDRAVKKFEEPTRIEIPSSVLTTS